MGGALFGARFELDKLLGSGGMARVHRAYDTRLGRTVAVKTLLPELARDAEARKRFAREARAAAALNHPGIVIVHDQDEVSDPDGIVPYLVMEYIDGATLQEVAHDQAPLGVVRAVRITCEVLDALAHAHSRGTVHRDVKPANVMITKSGVVKVADFGIARVVDATSTRITGTGFAVGTPGYMAPEQVLGQEVDARGDLYAVGCMLTELLTGAVPFSGSTPLNVMYQHVHQPPPRLAERNPEVPAKLESIVLKSLAKDPAARHDDAAQLRDDLQTWLDSEDMTPAAEPAGAPAAAPRTESLADPRPPAPPWPPAPPAAASQSPPFPLPVPGTPAASVPPAPAAGVVTPGWGAAPPGQAPYPVFAPPHPQGPPPGAPGTPSPFTRPNGTRAKRGWIIASVATAVTAVLVVTALIDPFGNDKHSGGNGGDKRKPEITRDAALTKSVNPSNKKGDVLKLATATEIDSLDPARSYTNQSWNIQRILMRKLVDYAPAPGGAGTRLKADLAQDLGEVSDDGKTYTFTLKDGLRYEDGSPITTQDIKYGIERSFVRADPFATGPQYLVEQLDQGQSYQGPYDAASAAAGLNSIETPDSQTIIFHLKKPFPDFRYLLAMPVASPVPASKDTKERYEQHPVSSGPYKLRDSYDKAGYGRLVLVPNTEWKPSTDSIRSALPAEIQVERKQQTEEVDQAVLGGAIDLDASQRGLEKTTWQRIGVPGSKELKQTDTAYTGAIRYLSLQTTVQPLGNVHCRKAIEFALNKKAIQSALGGERVGAIANNMLPPTINGYRKDGVYGDGNAQPDQAKKELQSCGKPEGFTISLVGNRSSAMSQQILQVVSQNLAAIHVEAKIELLDIGKYYEILLNKDEVRKRGWGIVAVSFASDWPSAGGFLKPLLSKDSTYNYAQLSSSEIDDLVSRAEQETDRDKAAKIWGDVDQALMKEAVTVPLTYSRVSLFRSPKLTNVYFHPAFVGYDLQALGLQKLPPNGRSPSAQR